MRSITLCTSNTERQFYLTVSLGGRAGALLVDAKSRIDICQNKVQTESCFHLKLSYLRMANKQQMRIC